MASSTQIDSDEDEVFWGPITMKEIKASLRVSETCNGQQAKSDGQRFKERNGAAAAVNGTEKNDELHFKEIQIGYTDQNAAVKSPEKSERKHDASTPCKSAGNLSYVSQLDQEKTDSSNMTPQSSPIKDNDTSAYTTPSVMSPYQNECDSSFASVTSSFVDESESPALDVASESFEKIDPKHYNIRNINDLDSTSKATQGEEIISSLTSFRVNGEKILNEPSAPTNGSHNFCDSGTDKNFEKLSNYCESETNKGMKDASNLKEKLSKALGTPSKFEAKNENINTAIPDSFRFSLKPLNFSQLTEVNISCESPPNLTLLDDTLMSVNQSRLSTCSNLGRSLKFPNKKLVKGPSNLPTLKEKLPQKKYFSSLTAPKVYATKPVLNGTPAGKGSVVVTPTVKEPKLDAASATQNSKSTLLSSGPNKFTPRTLKTPLKNDAMTSDTKKKFFSTPPSVRSLRESKLKPGVLRADAAISKLNQLSPANINLSTPNNPTPTPEKNASCGKASAEPKKKLFSVPNLSKIPSGSVKLEIPRKTTPRFTSNLNPTRTTAFSKNNSPASASKIPATSIPKFFPSFAKKTVQNKENLTGGTSKNEDFESSSLKYSSDSSLPLSDASFNSSLNSNKSCMSGVRTQKSTVDGSKGLVKTRLPLPRFNEASRIPKVNFTAAQKTGKQ